MGKIEDLAAEILTAGLPLNRMLYAIFVDALPVEYEVGARNLACSDNIDLEEIINAVRERHRQLSGNREKGSNSGHALYTGEGAGDGHGKGGGRGSGQRGRPGKHGRGRRDTIRSVVARPRLPVAMESAPKPPKVVP